LGAGAQRGDAVAGLGERFAQTRRFGVGGAVVLGLFEGDVRGGVADEQDGEQEGGDRDRGAGDDDDVAGGELGGEQAAEAGGECDAAVARGFVEPERQAAAFGADEVDLHDHGH
jgi:hypothetical protein